ncbi:hypothetical protein BDZ45DRAFT_51520 [Acephala macrosclerotiorum]|nr:hypothetical protein BDZ45DRAFT_51520 [Acephala macrosclerotiorum]
MIGATLVMLLMEFVRRMNGDTLVMGAIILVRRMVICALMMAGLNDTHPSHKCCVSKCCFSDSKVALNPNL